MHVVPQCLQGATLKINVKIIEEMLCMVPQCLVHPFKQGHYKAKSV